MSFSSDSFFETQPRPSTLQTDVENVRQFVNRHQSLGRRVVLITSGGTTVPLEHNVVRFLDNFSAGTRGATSAEYFLKANYAVVFMHRQFSLQPFSRHYSHSTNPFLDLLTVDATSGSTQEITITQEAKERLLSVLASYRIAQREGTLLTLTFITINDYLWLLRGVSKEMAILGRGAMYYLAAAVSDFFVPTHKLSEHKIQSGKGSLQIEMDQVPKVLKPMVDLWAPGGFIVSFKLETNPALLIPKSRGALETYGHQVVVGNDLNRRKFEVVFVFKTVSIKVASAKDVTLASPHENPIELPDGTILPVHFTEEWVTLPQSDVESGKEIEEEIIRRLVEMHNDWVEQVE